jgi:hypothetical protein
MHVPAEQNESTEPPGHALPHAPQLSTSEVTLTQRPSHSIEPVKHVHAPAVQVWSVRQRFPHAPQWERLIVVSTQPAPGQLRAVPVQVHAPATQVPTPQLTPHEPQLRASVMRSAQSEPHMVCPVGQRHTPPSQGTRLQKRPHMPQLLRSVIVSTQRPEHIV